jgi:LysM repeat protein
VTVVAKLLQLCGISITWEWIKMNKPTAIKHLGLMLLVSSFAVGCASTTEEAPPEEPAAVETAPAPAPAEPAPTTMNYEVSTGDNLWDISGKPSVYADPFQWPLIFKANSDQIEDADLIYPGQVLTIDTAPSDADVSAAVQHARTRGSWSVGVVEESDRAFLGQ